MTDEDISLEIDFILAPKPAEIQDILNCTGWQPPAITAVPWLVKIRWGYPPFHLIDWKLRLRRMPWMILFSHRAEPENDRGGGLVVSWIGREYWRREKDHIRYWGGAGLTLFCSAWIGFYSVFSCGYLRFISKVDLFSQNLLFFTWILNQQRNYRKFE